MTAHAFPHVTLKFNKAAVRKIFRIYVATTYHPIPSIRVNVRPKTLKLGIGVVELTYDYISSTTAAVAVTVSMLALEVVDSAFSHFTNFRSSTKIE